jgi:hypothetical protein
MLSYDSAGYCFQIIQTKTYCAEGRWGAAFPQFLPLMALKNHCSLKLFLQLYSVSFILIYYFIFFLCTVVLRNNKAGLILMLSMCLGFRWMFYYTICELFMGMAFSILFYAIIAPENPYSSSLKKWMATLISLPLIYTISYLHQLALFPVLFIVLYELIGNKKKGDIHLWIVIMAAIAWSFIRIHFLSEADYNGGKILSIGTYFTQLFNIINLTSWWYFKTYFKENLPSLCYTGLICLIIAAYRKNWLLLGYLILFTSIYIALIVLTYYKGESTLMYQHYYPPIGLFVAVAFINLIYNSLPKKLLYLIVAILLFFNVKGIYQAHAFQTERNNYLQSLTNYGHKLNAKKNLLDNRNIPTAITSVQWALPYETLMFSSIPSPDSAVTFSYYYDSYRVNDLINKENAFIGHPWALSDYSTDKLYKEYFHLPSTGYLKMNTPQSDTSFHESIFNSKNVFLSFQHNEIHATKREKLIVSLAIINKSGKTINSTPDGNHPVYLSYHIYDENGNIIRWDTQKTTLEVDIKDEYTQVLYVEAPNRHRTYIIEADFYTEGLRWWFCTSRFKLVVQ